MSPNSFEGGQNNYGQASRHVDKKENKIVSIDALRLLKDTLRDKPPRFKDLPDQVELKDNYLHFSSSLVKLPGYDDSYSIFDLNEEMRRLGSKEMLEIGASIVVDNRLDMRLGPLIQGDSHGVPVFSVLKENWIDLPNKSGKILRGEKMAAFFHTHPTDETFSSTDIQVLIKNKLAQLYVASFRRDIYMLQSTVESERLLPEEISRLTAMYDQEAHNIFRKYEHGDVISGALHALLKKYAQDLKLGYYSNKESKKDGIMNLEK